MLLILLICQALYIAMMDCSKSLERHQDVLTVSLQMYFSISGDLFYNIEQFSVLTLLPWFALPIL